MHQFFFPVCQIMHIESDGRHDVETHSFTFTHTNTLIDLVDQIEIFFLLKKKTFFQTKDSFILFYIDFFFFPKNNDNLYTVNN